MVTQKRILPVILCILVLVGNSCRDLTKVNENPNGVTPENVNPASLMTEVLTESAKKYVGLGYGDIAGVMQQTQKDAFSGGHNDYDWSDQGWSGYYALLRNNKKAYEQAKQQDRPFIMGVSLVMKSFLFGLVTDIWGPAPYTAALNGNKGGTENLYPAYDSQEIIYKGIIDDLKKASDIFANSTPNVSEEDIFYNGDASKWQKFANSLLLRYYMRLSSKLPDFAQKGVEEVVTSGVYFKSNDDDATMDYIGTDKGNSWPESLEFDDTQGSNFRRIKMCDTFVDTLQRYDDPRLAIWAAKVQIPITIDANYSSNPDTVINGTRYIHPDAVPAGTPVDTDSNYVGIPPGLAAPSAYNLNPTPGQLSYNPHVSFLNDRYKKTSGPLLKARLISYAEVNFILAEAALKGWTVGSGARTYYEEGIKASLDAWGVGSDYGDYIKNTQVAYNGTLQQIITQKWIASWTAATEAWFDYRRTGYPALQAGPKAKRKMLPVRFYYSSNELNENSENIKDALDKLKVTNFSASDGANSAWSKPWIIQGTNQPW